MAKLMTARYAGKCITCAKPIAVGANIFYGGRGKVSHAECTVTGRKAARLTAHVCNVTCNLDTCGAYRSAMTETDETTYSDRNSGTHATTWASHDGHPGIKDECAVCLEADTPVLCDGSEADHARLGCKCPDLTGDDYPDLAGDDSDARYGYGSIGHRYGGIGKYAYTASGARMTDRASRCEDAPCCGCCD
jgi:hypothetical protein